MDSVQCLSCSRYWGAWTCEAFPDGIPEDVKTGVFDHTKPHPSDKGLQFDPLDDLDDEDEPDR